MQTSKAQWIAVVAVVLAASAEVRAHGFVFSGGFTPPPAPPGLGNPGPSTNGGTSGFPGASGTGGGSAGVPSTGGTATPPPAGGGSSGAPGVGGGSVPGVGGGPAGGGTPRSSGSGPVGGGSGPSNGGSAPTGRPSGRPSAPPAPGAGPGFGGGPSGATRTFGGPIAARPRPSEPWIDDLRIDWTAEFLPYDKTDQYAAVSTSALEALRRPVEAGGWRRADRPTVVVFVDAADPAHTKALRALDADGRLRVAARLFNCFRVDAGAKSSEGSEVRFAAFRSDGAPVGEVVGAGKPSRIYELLARAYDADARGDLGAACAVADPLIKHSAHCRWLLRKATAAVVCPDCGELRDDVLKNVQQLKERREEAERRINEFAETRRA